MEKSIVLAIAVLWMCFLFYWARESRGQKSTERMESQGSRQLRTILMLAAMLLLLVPPRQLHFLHLQMLPEGSWRPWLALLLTVAGMGVSVWARVHLGRNWSQAVTVKEEHELIRSGPYRLLRHPIYTGFLLAVLGMVALDGIFASLLGFGLVALALVKKILLEEQWLAEHFGERWLEYRKDSRKLIPYVY